MFKGLEVPPADTKNLKAPAFMVYLFFFFFLVGGGKRKKSRCGSCLTCL